MVGVTPLPRIEGAWHGPGAPGPEAGRAHLRRFVGEAVDAGG
ncbi:hypothetical protein ACSMX9_17295 [Streptomyces sp. LE64]